LKAFESISVSFLSTPWPVLTSNLSGKWHLCQKCKQNIRFNVEHNFVVFSDVNWQWVDEATKRKIQVESRDDGEFWMSFKDFCRHFQEVTICLLGPDFDGDGVTDAVGE
jgi:hypothetical protein